MGREFPNCWLIMNMIDLFFWETYPHTSICDKVHRITRPYSVDIVTQFWPIFIWYYDIIIDLFQDLVTIETSRVGLPSWRCSQRSSSRAQSLRLWQRPHSLTASRDWWSSSPWSVTRENCPSPWRWPALWQRLTWYVSNGCHGDGTVTCVQFGNKKNYGMMWIFHYTYDGFYNNTSFACLQQS